MSEMSIEEALAHLNNSTLGLLSVWETELESSIEDLERKLKTVRIMLGLVSAVRQLKTGSLELKTEEQT